MLLSYARALLGSLAVVPCVLAASCGEDPGPEEAVRAAVQALRQGDAVAFHRSVSAEEEAAQAAAKWSSWKETVPEGFALSIDELLARLRNPEAAAEMLAGIEPALPLVQAEWRRQAQVQSETMASAAPWLVTDPATRAQALALNEAMLELALELELADRERAAAVLEALAAAARELRFGSWAELAALSFEELLGEASKLLRFAKTALTAYGIDLDAVLDTVEIRVAPESEDGHGERALVELTFELAGERLGPMRLEMARSGGRWLPAPDGEPTLEMDVILGLMDPTWRGFVPPASTRAAPLAWSDDPVRPVVRVLATGAIVAGGTSSPPEAQWAELGSLGAWLEEQARAMAKHPVGAAGNGWPRSPLLVCADARAPFERVLTLMTLCGSRTVGIADLRLAAQLPGGEPGMLAIPLPTDEEVPGEEEDPPLQLFAAPDGGLECRAGSARTRDREALGSWLVETAGVQGKTVTLEVASTVTCAHVATALDACAQAGVRSVLFAWPEE